MNLLHLKYFSAVAKCSHMSEAARQLNLSEPSLSLTISRLEKELGVALFDRVGRNIRLNEQGRIFYDYISRGLYLIETGTRTARESHSLSLRTLTVLGTAVRMLNNFSVEYLMKNPEYLLNVQEIAPDEINDAIHDSNVNFILSSVPVRTDNCRSLLLATERMYVVLNRNHPLAHCKSLPLSAIKNEPLILPPKKSGIRLNTDLLFVEAGFVPNVVLECDLDLRISLVGINKGVTIAAESAILWEAFPDTAVFIPISSKNSTRTLRLLWNQDRLLLPIEQKFIQEISDYYDKFSAGQETPPSVT